MKEPSFQNTTDFFFSLHNTFSQIYEDFRAPSHGNFMNTVSARKRATSSGTSVLNSILLENHKV